MEHLSEEERAKVGLIADRIVTVLADRYSIKPQEVQEAMLRKVREDLQQMEERIQVLESQLNSK
jgi:Tfp pilus assembly protein PilO